MVFSASHLISLYLSFFICKINPSNTIGSASYSKLHLMLNHVFYLSICLLIFIVSSSGQRLSLEVSYNRSVFSATDPVLGDWELSVIKINKCDQPRELKQSIPTKENLYL